MFLLFGRRGLAGLTPRQQRIFITLRLVLLGAFLLAFLAFHPHGTTLDVLDVVRLVLLVAVLTPGWWLRRVWRVPAAPDAAPAPDSE